MSVKKQNEHLLIILRTKNESKCVEIPEHECPSMNYIDLAERIDPNLQIEHCESCDHPNSEDHIKSFDEKLEIQKFKFGVIYQRKGQVHRGSFSRRKMHRFVL